MCKMITISLAQRADIVNLDSCYYLHGCYLYTNREVANSAAALRYTYIARCVYLHNNYQI